MCFSYTDKLNAKLFNSVHQSIGFYMMCSGTDPAFGEEEFEELCAEGEPF